MQVYFRNDYTSAIVDIINNTFPDRFETIPNIKARGDSFRKQLLSEILPSHQQGQYKIKADG